MEAIKTIKGPVSVLDRSDVDTDQIMPKQFLKRVERTGFGEFLFHDWAKQPGWELPRNPILVTGRNFGCGSSREHAPWGLEDYGFKAVIAPSFADIFASNCTKIGLLPVALAEDEVRAIMAAGEAEIDLDAQEVRYGDGSVASFAIDPETKHRLFNGLDDIALTLAQDDAISRLRGRPRARRGWARSRRRYERARRRPRRSSWTSTGALAMTPEVRDWNADAYHRVSAPQVEMARRGARPPRADRRRDRARRRLRLGPRHTPAARPPAARAGHRRRRLAGHDRPGARRARRRARLGAPGDLAALRARSPASRSTPSSPTRRFTGCPTTRRSSRGLRRRCGPEGG